MTSVPEKLVSREPTHTHTLLNERSWWRRLVNRLDTALHITALHHGPYVGAIPIWGGGWHDQTVGRHSTTRCSLN
jgi:hypothetical protein